MAMTEETYRSDAFAAIHETAAKLTDAGTMDKRTLRSFDEMCLTPVELLEPNEIRCLRGQE